MKKFIFANWKANPSTHEEAEKLARETDYDQVILFPPSVYIDLVAGVVKKSGLGSQDVSLDGNESPKEKSVDYLKRIGVKYVIVGHSDRRRKEGESNGVIAQKCLAVLEGGLTPILCVGETREEKESGRQEVVIREQIESVLKIIKKEYTTHQFYIAYEPVWAISTSNGAQADTPRSAESTILLIQQWVKRLCPILQAHYIYGGSVDSTNVVAYCDKVVIEGVLVGSASLRSTEFKKMIELVPDDF